MKKFLVILQSQTDTLLSLANVAAKVTINNEKTFFLTNLLYLKKHYGKD